MIFILGFGRSGTTWLSDIISKAIGGLILFEPMHPQVMDNALEYCYYDGSDETRNLKLKQHFDRILSGDIYHRWLIRNHLPSPMEGPSDWYVNQLTQHCSVGGFKIIRGNFLIDFLKERYQDSQIVYVRRDPLAVIASVKKRTRFWEEFGIEAHLEMFGKTVLSSHYLSKEEKEKYQELRKEHDSILGNSAIMWKYTDIIATRNLEKYGTKPVSYEDIYFNPYQTVKNILENLNVDPSRIHPSYIFTPSMLTLKTQHSFIKNNENMTGKYKDLFWGNILDSADKKMIEEILEISIK